MSTPYCLSLFNCDSLLIVTDGKLQVTRDDTLLLVITRRVPGKLENLSGEVLEDGSQVDGSTGTDTLGVVALAEETVDTADGERQTSLGGTAAEGGKRKRVSASVGKWNVVDLDNLLGA